MLVSSGADHLAIFVGGKLVSSGTLSFDAGRGLATVSGISSPDARRVTRVINRKRAAPIGTAVTLVPSQTTIQPGEAVTLEVFVTGGISDLRAYQVGLEISGGTAGLLTTNDLWMDTQRTDYVFRGLEKLDAADHNGGRIGAVLLSGGAGAMETGYLGTYTLRASSDASGTFSVSIRTKDTSMVVSTGNQFIRFGLGQPVEITIGTQPRRHPTEQR